MVLKNLFGEDWRGHWHPTLVLLPEKSHGWRSLVGCSPWGHEESDTTERLPFHFSLSCIGEGNGNPLQCSCLESPRDGGAWWAAVSGVAQSQTRLKRLSSSSSKEEGWCCRERHPELRIPFGFRECGEGLISECSCSISGALQKWELSELSSLKELMSVGNSMCLIL